MKRVAMNNGFFEKILSDFAASNLHTKPVDSSDFLKTYLKAIHLELDGETNAVYKKGTNDSRELEKITCAFGAQLSTLGIDTFFLHAFFQSVMEHSEGLFPNIKNPFETIQWLERLALHAFFDSSMKDHMATMQKLLEASTPLFKLAGGTPCLLLLGHPSVDVLSGLLDQLFFLHKRVGSEHVVISLEHCDDVAVKKSSAWPPFSQLVKKNKVRVCWVGKDERIDDIPLPKEWTERFDSVSSAHTAVLKKQKKVF